MLKKRGGTSRYLCVDDADGKPKFLYCVNATVKDNTDEMDAVFFDEAMTGMLGISCEKMITIHGEDDPREIPQKITETVNKDKLMSMTVKDDRIAAINSVADFQKPANPAPLAVPPTAKEKQAASETIKAPATPAKRLKGQDKAKQA